MSSEPRCSSRRSVSSQWSAKENCTPDSFRSRIGTQAINQARLHDKSSISRRSTHDPGCSWPSDDSCCCRATFALEIGLPPTHPRRDVFEDGLDDVRIIVDAELVRHR